MEAHKFEMLRTASESAHPGYGGWLFDTWMSLNTDYFEGKLEAIAIIWGRIGRTCRLSHFDPGMGRITLQSTLLSPLTNNGCRYQILDLQLAQDALLHAMMHQAIYQELGHDGSARSRQTAHSNPAWVAQVKRIAPLLGHRLYATGLLEQKTPDRELLADWPYAARSTTYYALAVRSLL